MNRVGLILRATVVAAATALTLTGCSNAVEQVTEEVVEQAIEDELGEGAEVSVDEDSFSVDTEEGSFSAGAGEVPEDFPAEVPLVDGEVSFAQRLETGETIGWTVIISSSLDPKDAVEQVRSDLEGSGFTVDQSSVFTAEDASGGTITGEKDDLTVLVLIAGEDGETPVTYTVNQTPAA